MKLVIEEEGSELAAEVWERATRTSSVLVYPEARAAIAAAHRAGRITALGLRRASRDLQEACGAMRLIGVDLALADAAGDLAKRHALRGYDATHLATIVAARNVRSVLVTWDTDLARAAGEVGMPRIPS